MKINMTWRIWLLIIFLVLSLISVFGLPPKALQDGLLITSVEQNTSSFEAGLRQGQIIKSIDGQEISNMEDFISIMSNKFLANKSEKIIIETNEVEAILLLDQTPKITVAEISKTNLQLGLDLSGGSRALIKAENRTLTQPELQDLVDITSNRLNAFGISDVRVVPVSDLAGNRFMLVEIAGATPQDIEELLAKQGKFEAKIGNETAFTGGERDIASVARDAQQSGIESCNQVSTGEFYCNFRFTVYLSQSAAERHADITNDLAVNITSQGSYLEKTLDLYLDDNLVDTLLIGESLKGRVTTQIQISGSGSGPTREDAYKNAEESMHKLQTILITGSLPFKLEIVKLDTISPTLGNDFTNVILLAGIVALISASLIVFLRYRKWKPALALIGISFSEIIIILGVASLIKWNLDLPSIAGILATIGTGFDDQIVILDEAQSKSIHIKQRLKRAFAIILGAYFTALVSLLPLLWAGAGLLKGFAITTIIGITAGVFITRPAFSDIVKSLEK